MTSEHPPPGLCCRGSASIHDTISLGPTKWTPDPNGGYDKYLGQDCYLEGVWSIERLKRGQDPPVSARLFPLDRTKGFLYKLRSFLDQHTTGDDMGGGDTYRRSRVGVSNPTFLLWNQITGCLWPTVWATSLISFARHICLRGKLFLSSVPTTSSSQ